MKKKALGYLTAFGSGCVAYPLLEVAWRHYSHWTMSLTGGVCCAALYAISALPRSVPTWKKCALGSMSITCVEFLVGCVVNLWMQWNVWDYSNMPFNLLGQVCLLYSGIWYVLSLPAVKLGAALRAKIHALGR